MYSKVLGEGLSIYAPASNVFRNLIEGAAVCVLCGRRFNPDIEFHFIKRDHYACKECVREIAGYSKLEEEY